MGRKKRVKAKKVKVNKTKRFINKHWDDMYKAMIIISFICTVIATAITVASRYL